MKRSLSLILACLLLTGCGPKKQQEPSIPETETAPLAAPITEQGQAQSVSPLGAPTIIPLSDDGILVDRLDSGADEDAVMVTHDIIYYEDRETYDSGNPYGEGAPEERHSAQEAAAHMAALKAKLIDGVTAMGGVINTPVHSADHVVNLSMKKGRSEVYIRILSDRGFYVSGGSACARGKQSHVLAAMRLDKKNVDAALRVSFCPETPAEAVDGFLEALADAAKMF